MKMVRTQISFKDARGSIRDILDGVALDAITLIISKKGVVRGNHSHKKTTQYLYVLSGRVRYLSRKGTGKVRSAILGPGDLAMSPPGEAHAIVSLRASTFLAISHGPRHGRNYEADTFRLVRPLAA